MSDRYAVIGNPIEHSRSPQIHARFAQDSGQDMVYERLLAPLDGFAATVRAFRDAGGCGLNVTVPFKLQAFELATVRSERAQAAGAVNTLRFQGDQLFGDNTDGAGLVRDIESRLGITLSGRSVLLLGAGGAARGVLHPLLAAGVSRLTIANRSVGRAVELAALAGNARVGGCSLAELGDGQHLRDSASKVAGTEVEIQADPRIIVINATSSGLAQETLPLSDALLASAGLAYDMVYAAQPTPFLQQAARAGCAHLSDGLGMLVEQAAESFRIWRGVRPATAAVYAELRRALSGEG